MLGNYKNRLKKVTKPSPASRSPMLSLKPWVCSSKQSTFVWSKQPDHIPPLLQPSCSWVPHIAWRNSGRMTPGKQWRSTQQQLTMTARIDDWCNSKTVFTEQLVCAREGQQNVKREWALAKKNKHPPARSKRSRNSAVWMSESIRAWEQNMKICTVIKHNISGPFHWMECHIKSASKEVASESTFSNSWDNAVVAAT